MERLKEGVVVVTAALERRGKETRDCGSAIGDVGVTVNASKYITSLKSSGVHLLSLTEAILS